MSNELRIILSVVFFSLFLIARILLSVVQKIHRKNPEHMEKQKQREREYQERINRENEDLYNNYRFSDEEYSDEYYQDDLPSDTEP